MYKVVENRYMAKILIAEDNVLLTESLVEILQLHGHEVESVFDGSDAWKRVQTGEYDLFLTDYVLPSMDALSIISRIEADSRLDHVEIVVISGFDAARFSGHRRVKATFHKPFDLRDVLAVIEG